MFTNPRETIRRPVSSRFDPATGTRVTTVRLPKPRTTQRREALREQGVAR